MYVIKPIVCDYAIVCVETGKIVDICNIRTNAELIADILNADSDSSCAYAYDVYPYAKYKVIKAKREDKNRADDVLDNIKAEIEQDAFEDVNGSKYIFVNRVNQLIDKYKVESEE